MALKFIFTSLEPSKIIQQQFLFLWALLSRFAGFSLTAAWCQSFFAFCSAYGYTKNKKCPPPSRFR
ncbi:MAG: hypothetical protein ACOCUL_05220 [Bacteroidota bacterium]